MENRYKINYDIKQKCITNIHFKQGDTDSSILDVTLYDGGQVVDITGETIEFRFLKSDNTVVFQDSTSGVSIVNATNGNAICVLKNNTLSASGLVTCEIHRAKDGKQLTTPSFNFVVDSSIGEDGVKSTNYISSIESKLIGWQSAESTRVSNENTRISAESQRVTNENARLANYNNMVANGNIIFKQCVATESAISITYSTPSNGWTTCTLDTGKVMRYSSTSSSWIHITTVTPSVYQALLNAVTTPTYLAPETFYGIGVISSLAIQSPIAGCVVEGRVGMNLVSNGNFANGTTGWMATSATTNATQSVTNQVNTVTGSGTNATFWTLQALNAKPNQKLFIRAMVRVTDASCSKVLVQIYDGSTSVEAKRQTTPVANQWYPLYGVLTATANATTSGNVSVMAFYADAATANGKQMQIDGSNGNGVTIIDMGTDTSNPLYSLTADQINQRFPNFIPSTLTNTAPQELVFTGVNHINPKIGSITCNGVTCTIESDGTITLNGTSSDLTRFKITNSLRAGIAPEPTWIAETLNLAINQSYTWKLFKISGTNSNESSSFIHLRNKNDANDLSISMSNTSSTGTLSNKMAYSFIFIPSGTVLSNYKIKIQLALDSTLNTYIPYSETVVQIPQLNAVSDSIKDIFDGVLGKHTKNVKKYTLQASDILSLSTSNTNNDYVSISYSNMSDFAIPTTVDGVGTKISTSKTQPRNSVTLDSTDNVWRHWINTSVWNISLPKGTYANLAAAQTGLAGIEVMYQLAKPIETYYLQPTVINAVPNGLVYTNPALTFADGYSTKLTLPSMYSAYPIKSLKYVNKINPATGTLIPVDISTCTIASDGLSFTITGAVAGEHYDFGWYFDTSLSTVPAVTTTCSSDLKAAVNELVNALKRSSDMINNLQDEIAILNKQLIKTYATKADCTVKIAGETTIKAADLHYKILTWDGSAWRDAMGAVVA